jgi:hypothetical protein
VNRIILVLALWDALACDANAGTRVLTFIYQPLSTFGTDQNATVVVARVPVLTNALPESIIAHIASPNRLLQDTTAQIADSTFFHFLVSASRHSTPMAGITSLLSTFAR